MLSIFFFNDTATTEIYTLSLHDALPICSCWNDPFHGFGVSACSGGGRSHAGGRRRFLGKAHRAASLAHVLLAVYCSRVFFLRRGKPPTEIAFDSGAREKSIPRFIQHQLVFWSH